MPVQSVVSVSDFGASPLVANNSPSLQSAVAFALSNGISVVELEPWAIYRATMPVWQFVLGQGQTVEIDGKGATILFTNDGSTSDSWSQFMMSVTAASVFENTSFVLKNITFDMMYSPSATAMYTGNPSYGVYTFATYGPDPQSLMENVFDIYQWDSTGELLLSVNQVNCPLVRTSSTTYSIATTNTGLPFSYGQLVTLNAINQGGAIVVVSVDTAIYEDVTLYSSAWTGLSNADVGDITMRRCYVARKPGRLMSTLRDTVPISGLRGNLIVDGCTFGWSGDDIMNINNDLAVVASPFGATSSPIASVSSTAVSLYVTDWLNAPVVAGYNQFYMRDQTGAYVPDTSTFNGLACYTLVSSVYGGLAPPNSYMDDPYYYVFTLSGSPSGLAALTALGTNLNSGTLERAVKSTVLIENSSFNSGRSTGIIPDLTFDTTIFNCTFINLWNGAIGFVPTQYGQGPTTSNILIDSNYFLFQGPYWGQASFWGYIGFYSAPVYTNWVNSNQDAAPLSPRGQFNISIVNNIIYYNDGVGYNPGDPEHDNAIVITGATNVTVDNNQIFLTSGNNNKNGVYILLCAEVNIHSNKISGAASSLGVYVDPTSTQVSFS